MTYDELILTETLKKKIEILEKENARLKAHNEKLLALVTKYHNIAEHCSKKYSELANRHDETMHYFALLISILINSCCDEDDSFKDENSKKKEIKEKENREAKEKAKEEEEHRRRVAKAVDDYLEKHKNELNEQNERKEKIYKDFTRLDNENSDKENRKITVTIKRYPYEDIDM